jgi:hypothetical protein
VLIINNLLDVIRAMGRFQILGQPREHAWSTPADRATFVSDRPMAKSDPIKRVFAMAAIRARDRTDQLHGTWLRRLHSHSVCTSLITQHLLTSRSMLPSHVQSHVTR